MSRACSRLRSFFRAVLRWRVRRKRAEKVAGGCRYLGNGGQERTFVGFRWLVEAAELSDKLQRGRANLFLRHGRFEVE